MSRHYNASRCPSVWWRQPLREAHKHGPRAGFGLIIRVGPCRPRPRDRRADSGPPAGPRRQATYGRVAPGPGDTGGSARARTTCGRWGTPASSEQPRFRVVAGQTPASTAGVLPALESQPQQSARGLHAITVRECSRRAREDAATRARQAPGGIDRVARGARLGGTPARRTRARTRRDRRRRARCRGTNRDPGRSRRAHARCVGTR